MNAKIEGRLTGYAEGGRDTISFRTGECREQCQTGCVDGERCSGAGSPIGRPPGVVVVRVQFVPGPVCPVGGNSGRDVMVTFRALAQKLEVVMVVPFAERANHRLYIAAAVIEQNGALIGVYRKSFLWGREKHIFTPGEREYPVFQTSVGKLGVLICYDAEFPEPSRLISLQQADLIVVPAVWSVQAERRWDIQLPARALDNTVFVMGVNAVGGNSCGKSKFVRPDGIVLTEAPRSKEAVLICEMDSAVTTEVRGSIPYLKDYDFTVIPGRYGERAADS